MKNERASIYIVKPLSGKEILDRLGISEEDRKEAKRLVALTKKGLPICNSRNK